MAVTKIVLFPVKERVINTQLAALFTKCGIAAKCIYVSPRRESSFHQYVEGSAIMEFSSEHDALMAWKTVQNGKIELNAEILKAVQLPDDFSPIVKLTDNLLKKIFSLLPLSKNVDIERVCKRWNTVVQQCSYSDTKLDVRDFSSYEDVEKCITRFGSNLKEVYWNVNCSVLLLGKYCGHLENLTIDYQRNEKFCGQRDVDIRSTWRHFKRLARVLLTNVRNSNCDFLIYLPKTVMELQLIASRSAETTFAVPINLSNLLNLRSLMLIGFQFTDGLLVAFKELKKLSHLHIEHCDMDRKNRKTITNCETLEYITIKDDRAGVFHWVRFLNNSKNLKYLELSHLMYEQFSFTLSSHSLCNLKYLRVIKADDECLRKIINHRLPSLEYLDCQYQDCICNSTLLSVIADSPNLKFINVVGCNLIETVVKGIKSIKDKEESGLLKLFVGKKSWYKQTEPTYHSPRFMVGAVPEEEDKMLDVSEGWFTKDWETIKIISPVLSLLDDSSPIQSMPTECLVKIFSYLSMHDWLNVQEVYSRWKSIVLMVWQRQTSFDIRKLRYPEDAEKCIEQCGKNLETIYYYKDYALSPISNYCSTVKNVTIDFQDRLYGGEQRRGKPDIPDLQPTLSQLKDLTCLTLKNVDCRYNCDFLQDLPETLTDLYISLECAYPVENVDISKFVHLRALTFCNVAYIDMDGFVLIRGFEALRNLTYLCLEQMFMSEDIMVALSGLTKIEYLSLRRSGGFLRNSLLRVLENNRHLKYLNLSGFERTTGPVLNTILNLPNLKTLCLDDYDNPDDAALDEVRGIPSLEYFDYGTSRTIQQNILLNIISSSPNLRLLIVRSIIYDAQQVLNAAIRATLGREDDDPPLKLVLGESVESVDTAGAQLVLPCRELGADERDVFEIQFNEQFMKNRNK